MRRTSGILLIILILFGCRKQDFTSSTAATTVTATAIADSTYRDSTLYTVTGTDTTDKGIILLSFATTPGATLAILNEDGYVVKEKTVTAKAENFQKWTVNGLVRYTYFYTNGTYMIDNLSTTEIGYQAICDSNLNVIDSVSLLTYGSISASVQDKLDMHDFIFLGDGHYIAETSYPETVTNVPDSLNPGSEVNLVVPVIQEIENGQVIWQFHASDFPEFYGVSVENNNYSSSSRLDYMHLNSMCIDPNDSNLVCSFRNLNQIIKLNRKTGEIMWRLGGSNSDFTLTSDEKFLRQHYARFIDDGQTLLFLDNGETSERASSRIVQFQLDQTNKAINSFTAFNVPDKFIQYAGSVTKEGNNFFIGGGSSSYAVEVNASTGSSIMRLNQTYSSYRAIKY